MSTNRKTTPADLARARISVDLPEAEYSHSSQTRFAAADVSNAITWNATQTFDPKGKPIDRDND
jgi:hypothetical protein